MKPSRFKSFLHFFSKSEWLNVFLTAVIAVTGVVGIILVIQGGDDTARIRDAAEKNARAARDFANTAALINGGIGDAVKKLDAQAKAVETSRKTSEANSKQALDATIGQSHLDERAWLGVTDISIKVLKAEARFVWVGSIQNSGKTPAVDSKILFQYKSFPKGQNPTFDYGSIDTPQAIFTIQPSAKFMISGYENPKEEPLSSTQIQAISDGSIVVYIYGYVTYDDVFHAHHYSHVCAWVDPNLQFTHPCASYNDTN